MTKISALGCLGTLGHTLFVLFIYYEHYEGSWGGLVVFMADLPASFLFLFVPEIINQWAAYAVIGGLWWYFIGNSVQIIFVKLYLRRKSAHDLR